MDDLPCLTVPRAAPRSVARDRAKHRPLSRESPSAAVGEDHVDHLELDAGGAVEGVECGFEGDPASAMLKKRLELSAHAEPDGSAAGLAVAQGEGQVLAVFPDSAGFTLEGEKCGGEARSRVAHAEGLKAIEVFDDRLRERGELDLAVEPQDRFEVLGSEQLVGAGDEGVGEGLDLVGGDAQAGGHRVPATGEQMVAAVGEGAVQIEVSDAAGRALALAVLEGDHHRRAVITLDDA